MGKCRHVRTTHLRWDGTAWGGWIGGVNCYPGWVSQTDDAVICYDCRAWLPLGPARDDGPHAEQVAIEVRAAEIAADVADGRALPRCGVDEPFEERCARCGWEDFIMPKAEPHAEWLAGYLARQIATHDDGGNDD